LIFREGFFYTLMKKINTDLPYYIGSYSINELIKEIESVGEDAEISWNSMGGSVWSGQQFVDFLNNKENQLTANVTGIAASMGAVLLPFFDKVKGAAQSDVMLHAGSGGGDAKMKHTNEFLYNALAKKIDEEKFEKRTGHNLKTVMLAEGENIVNVWFTGKDAKHFGLYDEVYDLLDGKSNTLLTTNEIGYQIPQHIAEKYGLKKQDNVKTKNDMDIKDITASQLLTGNPEVYNSILALGKTSEKERVAEIMDYGKYDLEKANELIKLGEKLNIKDVEYFMEKKFNTKKADDLEAGSEDAIIPAKQTVSKENKEKEDALSELDEITGVKDVIEKNK